MKVKHKKRLNAFFINKCNDSFRKFYNKVLNKETPLLNLTVLEVLVLWLVTCGGITATIFTRQQSTPTETQATTNESPVLAQNVSGEDNKHEEVNQQEDKDDNNTDNSVQQQPTDNNSTVTEYTDQWGCTSRTLHGGTGSNDELNKTMQGIYLRCVEVAKELICTTQEGIENKKLYAADKQARQEYNNIINGAYMIRDRGLAISAPPGTYRNQMTADYNQGVDYAFSQFRAIYDPVYAAYKNAIKSLNSTPNNCKIQYIPYSAPNYRADYIQ